MSGDQQTPSPKPSDLTGSPQARLAAFWAELKRRKVMRVAITYAVVAWLIIQIAVSTFEGFGIPEWAFRFVVIMLICFFPVALILAWAFELTPEGIKTSKRAREAHPEAHKDASVQRKRNRFSLLLAAGLPTAIFGTLALFFYFSRSAPEDSEVASQDKSIAVLPLENMSPDPENTFFADGVQEDILTNLSHIEELRVISRTSTLRYRDTVKSLTEISEELGVRYLVEGSVRRAGNQVRITVQLIDAQADDHLWAENYNRSLDDIFTIQSDVAKEIAGKLQAALSPKQIAQIERRPTENQEAYDLFVRVKQMIDSITGTTAERISLLEKAVALDAEFAEAWAQLAYERIDLWANQERRNNPGLLASAYQAFNEAKRLGPDLPYIPFVQNLFEWDEKQDYEKALSLLLEALAIDPSFHMAKLELARRYGSLGRLAESQHYREAVHRADPLSPTANDSLFGIYNFREMWNEARTLILRNLEWTDDVETWQQRLVYIDYLQSGDKQGYIAGMGAISGFIESSYGKAWNAILLQDYPRALHQLEQVDPDTAIQLTLRISLAFRPSNLVSALIYFETGDLEKQLIEAEKANRYLEGRIEEDPLISPSYLSCLTICYALEGNRQQMEANILKVRELSSSVRWKYMFEAEFEFHIATAYLIAGDHEAAIDALTKANRLEYHDLLLKEELQLWFIFDRLQGNPRFDALLK